jgi:hypothetical protein
MTELNTDIAYNVGAFLGKLISCNNHRYRSWEHCFLHFKKYRFDLSSQAIDLASLHLAFFLASWGMYRGSSKLLTENDYRVHEPVVVALLDTRYASLWDLNIHLPKEEVFPVSLLFQLVEELRGKYRWAGFEPTNTLITKVLLGTLCCTPAHDTNFKLGVKAWNNLQDDTSGELPNAKAVGLPVSQRQPDLRKQVSVLQPLHRR